MYLPTRCKKEFTINLANEIINMYKDGMSVSAISRQVERPYSTVNLFLINNNIKKVNHCKMSDNSICQIVDLINSGVHILEISRRTKSACSTILNIANEYGLELAKFKMPRDEKNKYFIDNYFSNIDNEAKAYYLGLIYTDGNVRIHNNGYYLNIELMQQDDYILKTLAKELKCNNELYYRERVTNKGFGKMVRFETCNSKQLFDDLGVFDIVPDKSHKSQSFKNIKERLPKDLIKHFLRGLIDGDGNIAYKEKHDRVIAIYQNSELFCRDFVDLLNYCYGENDFKPDISPRHNNMYVARYRRINDIKRICGFLYKDATIFCKENMILQKNILRIKKEKILWILLMEY